MTVEELRRLSKCVIVTRDITIRFDDSFDKADYYLVKDDKGNYYIGFSTDGTYGSCMVSEGDMLRLIENENLSSRIATEIYYTSPQLNFWLDGD